MQLLTKSGKFVSCRPRCSVKSFSIPEWSKERRRPLFWPDLNASISRDLLLKDYIPLKREIRKKVFHSEWSVQFDFASWYDQLPMDAEISPLFSVDGKTCLRSLPMGFRPSAEVAHIITEVIADFPLPEGVNVVVYIDNIRFGGLNKVDVQKAASDFLARADKVGAVLNERSCVPKRQEDFLGERFNLTKKTRCLTKKTLDKVRAALTVLPSRMSYRQVAAVFGLSFFCSEVLDLPLAKHFKAMRYYRKTMAAVDHWDNVAPSLSDEDKKSLTCWLKAILHNKPVPTWTSDESFPTLTIYCDASAYGWGAVCVSSSGVKEAGAPWSEEEKSRHNVQLSTVAEPLAVNKAVAAFVSTSCQHVKIMSDHQGLIFAGNAGYGKGLDYNNMCLKLLEAFPDTTFSFEFIPGELNVLADALSRNACNKIKTINKDIKMKNTSNDNKRLG